VKEFLIEVDFSGEVILKIRKICPKCGNKFGKTKNSQKIDMKNKGKLYKVKIIPPYKQSFGKIIKYYKKNITCKICNKKIGYVLNKMVFLVSHKNRKVFRKDYWKKILEKGVIIDVV